MESETAKSSLPQPGQDSNVGSSPSNIMEKESSAQGPTSVSSTSAISAWARGLKLTQAQQEPKKTNSGNFTFARLASGLGLQIPSKLDENADKGSAPAQSGVIGSLTKGIVDSSLNAVKAVQVKARHIVSQNKRRYQEGGFDLDMTYITENIIAMGFPAGDLSSGLFGYFEGFYRNHMEEVIKFFETHHKGKYKVYNLCSERLYDASLFEGKVACFPFDDHNCPPIHLIKLFCQSAYSWLKEDILNVVVVHCKAGKARTGLMICSLLLFLKFFPTAEDCISYYNQQRCVDGKGLILPSQIRYVKYFERILTQFNGEAPPGRRCMLRGFRLHNCPYWVRPSITISNHNGALFSTKKHPKTKDLMPEDFWIRAQKKGIVVFALPGEPGLTELVGDFKVHFHDHQGDFYCWMNTSLMENRVILAASTLDDFDKRKLPSPGFHVEIVMVDYDGTAPSKTRADDSTKGADGKQRDAPSSSENKDPSSQQNKQNNDDDVFSDSDGEEPAPSRSRSVDQRPIPVAGTAPQSEQASKSERVSSVSHQMERLSVGRESTSSQTQSKEVKVDEVERPPSTIPNMGSTDIKAIAADASVFSFGDDEDDESE
ncbi:phosphatidylinositol 3,4,5-trisphosphate 3-phosphatase and protein-tyrosine-phosphatase PTEN2A-like isoform X1 [Salvia splendens]|uniref:phosphatidylinositol 3,4,5-trisphosphate 3-phosphatase and protein-tyrosine-phosphatase PTEN2A-like isoform X1 n=1 Tax=Salvia splendens TaxID=180675 RepID=UPI001C26F2B7|nr:phosphatidylinositol 3,4,5-trisphosphate 3-phosphatase and protein-tyrosine-phosphatase PTEN2A-like isoform X1 [Salvia splendens]